jgi:hypothetical protein
MTGADPRPVKRLFGHNHCLISDFRPEVDENRAVLGYYAVDSSRLRLKYDGTRRNQISSFGETDESI